MYRASKGFLLVALPWVASCVADPMATPAASDKADSLEDSLSVCAGLRAAIPTGRVESSDASEVSGLVASRRFPGIFWAHNDGDGQGGALFAVSRSGEHLGAVEIPGISVEDLEDIALGPGPDPSKDYLYLADIGDNDNNRDEVAIVRIAEPEMEGPSRMQAAEVERFVLQYDDSDPHDAEALLVDPVSGAVAIVTKEGPDERSTRLYESADLVLGQVNVLEETLRDNDTEFFRGSVVAADLHPVTGTVALLFKSGGARLWQRRPGQSLASTLQGEPCLAPSAKGQQEAFAFSTRSEGYYLLPEGQDPVLSFVSTAPLCTPMDRLLEVGPVAQSPLIEASGLVVSRRHRDVLWSINDSGDGVERAEIVALGSTGEFLRSFPVPSATNIDWEDLAIGPGPLPGRSYLYVADIGDNEREREEVIVYRFQEPSLGGAIGQVEHLRLHYPGGRERDAEALFVDPLTGQVGIVSRDRGSDNTPRFFVSTEPLVDGRLHRLEQRLSSKDEEQLDARFSAADISADGRTIALLERGGPIRLYHRNLEGPIEEAFLHKACFGSRASGKHDSLALSPDGQSYFLLPEGEEPSLFRVD